MLFRVIPVLFVLLLTPDLNVQAAENDDQPSGTSGDGESGSGWGGPDHFGFRLYGGNFVSDSETQFVNLRNQYTLGIGLFAGFDSVPSLGLDMEYFFCNRDFDTSMSPPLFGTIDTDTSLETQMLLIGGRLMYPADFPLHVYAVGGFGLFKNSVEVRGATFGFPGEVQQDKMELNVYYGAGIDLKVGKWTMSLDFRRFDLDGNFDQFQITDADIGGNILVAGFGLAY